MTSTSFLLFFCLQYGRTILRLSAASTNWEVSSSILQESGLWDTLYVQYWFRIEKLSNMVSLYRESDIRLIFFTSRKKKKTFKKLKDQQSPTVHFCISFVGNLYYDYAERSNCLLLKMDKNQSHFFGFILMYLKKRLLTQVFSIHCL